MRGICHPAKIQVYVNFTYRYNRTYRFYCSVISFVNIIFYFVINEILYVINVHGC